MKQKQFKQRLAFLMATTLVAGNTLVAQEMPQSAIGQEIRVDNAPIVNDVIVNRTTSGLVDITTDGSIVITPGFKDGTYTVPVSLCKKGTMQSSMAAGSLEKEAKIIVANGKARIYLTFKPLSIFGMVGHLTQIWYENQVQNKCEIQVESTYLEGDTAYPEVISFELEEYGKSVDISMYVNELRTEMEATLAIDYSKIEGVVVETPSTEIQLEDEQTGIKATIENTTMPQETVLGITVLTEGSQFEALAAMATQLEKLTVYDLQFLANNQAIKEIQGTATVSIPIPKEYTKSRVKLYRQNEEGKLEVVEGRVEAAAARSEINYFIFNLAKPGIYILGHEAESKQDGENVKNGTYNVKVSMLKDGSTTSLSMANQALDSTAQIKYVNGKGTLFIKTKPMSVGTIVASLQELQYQDSSGVYQVADITNHSLDGNPTGFSFELPGETPYINIKVNPHVAIMGNQDIPAVLYVDYSTLREASSVEESKEVLTAGIYEAMPGYNCDENVKAIIESALNKAIKIESDGQTGKLYVAVGSFIHENQLGKIKGIQYAVDGSSYLTAKGIGQSVLGEYEGFEIALDNFGTEVNLRLLTAIPGMERIDVTFKIDYREVKRLATTTVDLSQSMPLPNGIYEVKAALTTSEASTSKSPYRTALDEDMQLKVENGQAIFYVKTANKSLIKRKSLQYSKDGNYVVATEQEADELVRYHLIFDELVKGISIKFEVGEDGKEETVTAYLKPDYTTIQLVEALETLPEKGEGETEGGRKPYMYGFEDGTFKPNEIVTKGEAAKMLAHLIDEDYLVREDYDYTYVDLDQTSEYAKAVSLLTEYGILNGYNGKSGAHKSLSRAELVAMLVRFKGLTVEEENVSFNDVSSDYWAAGVIATAASQGWIKGYTDGRFKPSHTVTRSEIATMINRMKGRSVNQETLEQIGAVNFLDVPVYHWAYYEIMAATHLL